MKRIFMLFLLGLCAGTTTACAQGLRADTVSYDLGEVELGGIYRTVFGVVSEADAAVILSVATNCDCTKASYPRKPLRRDETGKIEVRFEAKQAGYFRKKADVTYHAGGGSRRLTFTITGTVVPKVAAKR